MPRFKAEHINDLEPGCKVEINGRTYIRMADHPHYHIEEWVFDPETGQACHWSRLVMRHEMVSTVDAQWQCPACNQIGASHCSHPEECGGMKLRKVSAPCAVRDGRCESSGYHCQERGACNPHKAAAYQGHLPDGSSVQRHSAGSFYPYVLALRDSQDPSRRYDWGLMGPDINGVIWMRSSESWERLAREMLRRS